MSHVTLYDLQAGDRVLLCQQDMKSIVHIDRVTKTQIIIGLDKYRKSDGWVVSRNGIGKDTQYIKPLSIENEETFRKKARYHMLLQQVRSIDFSVLNDIQLQSILDIALTHKNHI